MGRHAAQVNRIVLIGSAGKWWARPVGAPTPVDRVPSFSAPTAGGFMFRRDRARYHEHLEALRIAVARRVPATLITEGRLPSRSTQARIDAQLAAQGEEWTVLYIDRRGRLNTEVDPRSYVVSQRGAVELLDHLTSVLATPRSAAFGADALSGALRDFAPAGNVPAAWVDEELPELSRTSG